MNLTPNPTEIYIHPSKINPPQLPQIILQYNLLCCLLLRSINDCKVNLSTASCNTLFNTFMDHWHIPDKNARS